MKRWQFFFCIGIVLFLSATVLAGTKIINFQGFLSDDNGPVNDSNLQMAFSIYDDSTEGTQLWTETNTVRVHNGNYNVLLGNQSPFPEKPALQM